MLSQEKSSTEPTRDDTPTGWIACTTDEILTHKTQLFDLAIELPHPSVPDEQPKDINHWPKLRRSDGTRIFATRRDLRRWRTLREALGPTLAPTNADADLPDEDSIHGDEERMRLLYSQNMRVQKHDLAESDEEKAVEPISWSALAYSSFMWWASAGERDEHAEREEHQDSELLGDLPDIVADAAGGYRDEAPVSETQDEERSLQVDGGKDASVHTAIIAYFQAYTKLVFSGAASALGEESGDSEEGDKGKVVLDSDDLRAMGLDPWSEADARFVEETCKLWFEKEVAVKGMGVEACGVRWC